MTGQTAAVRVLEGCIRCAILAVLGLGVRQRSPGAVVNAVVAFAASYAPDLVERRYGVEFRPWQRFYTGITVLAHAAGMLGPYDDTGWWDHVTHTASAALLGGVAHATADRRDRDPRPRVVAIIVGGGVLWEAIEYVVHAVCDRLGLEPVLIPYSARDTVLDLVFDLVGALLVLLFGDRLLRNFTDRGE